MILCITGGPGTGKTHLATMLALESGARILHTDDAIAEVAHLPKHEQWSAASQLVAQRMVALTGDWIVEGVAVPRALRKAIAMSPTAPCERVIVLRGRRAEAGEELRGHRAMATQVANMLAEIAPELQRRGVVIEERGRDVAADAARAGELLAASRRSWKVLA